MEAAERIDLNVINDDGAIVRLCFIFIDGKRAVVRQGLIRHEA